MQLPREFDFFEIFCVFLMFRTRRWSAVSMMSWMSSIISFWIVISWHMSLAIFFCLLNISPSTSMPSSCSVARMKLVSYLTANYSELNHKLYQLFSTNFRLISNRLRTINDRHRSAYLATVASVSLLLRRPCTVDSQPPHRRNTCSV